MTRGQCSDRPDIPDVDDSDFSARIRARDPDALRIVVDRYLRQMFRTTRAAGLVPQVAEDVVQDTFVTVFEAAPRFEGRSHVRTWLFGILFRKIADARRRLRRDFDTLDPDHSFDRSSGPADAWLRPPPSPETMVIDGELRQAIDDCLDTAPDKQRLAFVLRDMEDITTPEVCEILQVTPTHLGVLLHRVRRRLRRCLDAKGVAP